MDAGTYVFVVDQRANKIEIRDAVQSAFGVRVASVNTMNRKGKRKRQRAVADLRAASGHQARDRPPDRRRPHRAVREAEDDTMALRKRKPTSPGRRFQARLTSTRSPRTGLSGRSSCRKVRHGRP